MTLTRGSLKKEFREKGYGVALAIKVDSFCNTLGVKSARIFTNPGHRVIMKGIKSLGYSQYGEL